MQPDGSLNPSPTPVELPDPSDSAASYWLARTLWAFGEGYAAFRRRRPGIRRFPESRGWIWPSPHCSVMCSATTGSYQIIHGVRVPAWLIVDGADASSEAVLGLAAYVQATGDRTARTALPQLARGIAAHVRRLDHQMAVPRTAALGTVPIAYGTPGVPTCPPRWRPPRPHWAQQACWHRLSTTRPVSAPQLLTSTGPINGLLPTPVDATQIAYGADARVQGLLAVGTPATVPGSASWPESRPAGSSGRTRRAQPVYDPATGVTKDGVRPTAR